ncbi:MAG: methyltransferase domain-containing protein [Acidobacteriota bacterium]
MSSVDAAQGTDPGDPGTSWNRDRAAAARFETCSVPFLLGPWIPDLVQSVQPAAHERILDLACGTGAVAREVVRKADPSGRVTGVDLNPDMLSVAQEAAGNLTGRIQWKQGNAVPLPFPGRTFDMVLCHQGLQFFPDRNAALREIRRVLTPGGRVALGVWGSIERNPYPLALARSVERYLGAAAGATVRASFSLGDRTRLQALLAAAGFTGIHVQALVKTLALPPLEEFIPRHLASTSLAHAAAALEPASRAALVADVVNALGPVARSASPAFPFETLQAVARTPGPEPDGE